MVEIRVPLELLPLDGRFGSGPSLVRPAQLDAIRRTSFTVVGTSHRQPPVKAIVHRIREGLAELFSLPDGYEIALGVGGASAFWDAAAFGLAEHRGQAVAFGEFGGKFAAALETPWLDKPDVVRADPGSLAVPHPRPGIDLYAWPQNETSTGVMAPVRRIEADAGALTVVDATSAAGGVWFDPADIDAYYFSPQKNFGSDGGLWIAVLSPAAIERIERIAASDRYVPQFLSLARAVENSRVDQTLNTPAIITLLLLDAQIAWFNENGGLRWCDERTRSSSRVLYDWAEASDYATPFVGDADARSQVGVTIDLDEAVPAHEVSRILRANGVLDIDAYRKLGRNQLRVGTFVAVDRADVARLTRSIDYVVERLR